MVEHQSIRTLFLTRHPVYPLAGGAILRNWQNINIMMKLGEVAVFSIGNPLKELPDLPAGSENLLWEHHALPDRKTSIAQKLQSWSSPYRYQTFDALYDETLAEKLAALLDSFKPDLVVFEELWTYRYLPIVKRHPCQVILDNHNIEAPLFIDKQRFSVRRSERIKSMIAASKIKRIEQDFIKQSDQVWVCSAIDAQLTDQLYGNAASHIVPNALSLDYYKDIRIGTCEIPDHLPKSPRTLVFAANYAYIPNQVAAQFLIEDIFPKLQAKFPNCCLILAGRDPTSGMLEAAEQNSSIVVTGTVADIRPYLAASSVVIVPLLQGGGTRLKILEAFASNRPVVSTAKGAEGINAQDHQHLLIRNTADELVQGIDELWTNPALYQTLAQNAYELFKKKYSWEAVETLIAHNIKTLLSGDRILLEMKN